jgi:16S rRNA (guanine1207-N2)-methyltransferase
VRGDIDRIWASARADARGEALFVEPAGDVLGATWHRWAPHGLSPDLPAGPFDTVVLRVPRGREALAVLVELSASRLRPSGCLRVWGGNDEGIRGAGRALLPWFAQVETGEARGHGRVVVGRAPRAGARSQLLDFAVPVEVRAGALRAVVHSVPGLFAHARLDAGSALLAEALGPARERWLDFGCGAGMLGALRGGDWTGVDADTWAVAVARATHPDRVVVLGDRTLPRPAVGGWDRVVSNPPLHRGGADDDAVVSWLVDASPAVLAPDGEVVVVLPRRVPFRAMASARYREVDVVASDDAYRVWRARGAHPASLSLEEPTSASSPARRDARRSTAG